MAEAIVLWLVRISLIFLAVISLLPLVPTGAWFVRICDFPRLQVLLLLIPPTCALAALAVWKRKFPREYGVLTIVIVAVVGWQGAHILPFTPVWPEELPAGNSNPTVRLMVANVTKNNEKKDEVRGVIEQQDPDLLLLVEINESWAGALQSLRRTYPYREEVIRDEGLGIALWSKLPLRETEVRHLVSDRRASIFTDVELPDGTWARFCGIHPTPPGLRDETPGGRRDSRVRDAELVLVADQVKDNSDRRWIVAGDFNDVAWSDTTSLFKHLSGLRDPRVGRSLLNTYHAEHPLWRYPIDQLFLPESSEIHSLSRVYLPGSDHFAVIADFHIPPIATEKPSASSDEISEAEEIVEEGEEDAEKRNVESDEAEQEAIER